jgi:uncharacterized protein
MAKDALIVFVKEPIAGKVKTRLGIHIGFEVAKNIYISFLKELNEQFSKIDENIDIHFFYNLSNSILKTIFPAYTNWHSQVGKDLGEKMHNAFLQLFQHYKHIAIIGSDMPHLDMNYIKKSISVLNYVDLAIGESEDGGYYLLALKKDIPSLFNHMEWSTETVFNNTLARAKKADLEIFELPINYDIDDVESLKRLNESPDLNKLKHVKKEILSLKL